MSLPWKWGQGHPVRTWFSFYPSVSVYRIWWGYVQYFLRYWAGTIFHVVALNDLCDLQSLVKIIRFELGLTLALVLLYTKFGEDKSNNSWDIAQKPYFIGSIWIISVTLKMRSMSPDSNSVFILPWCFIVPNLVKIGHIFLEILRESYLSYAVALNGLCDLQNELKVTWFELGPHFALVH